MNEYLRQLWERLEDMDKRLTVLESEDLHDQVARLHGKLKELKEAILRLTDDDLR